MKVLGKILKPRDKLYSSRENSDDEVSTLWIDDNEPKSNDDDEETSRDGNT